MKKFFGIILIVSILIQETLGQDTVRLCASLPPYSTISNLPSSVCGAGAGLFMTVFNGDTLVIDVLGANNLLGEQGTMFIGCNSAFGGIDTSYTVYFLGNAMPQICVITSDSNNHPVVFVDSSTLWGDDMISLQRQVTTTSWQTVATFTPYDPLVIVDSSANTSTQSYHYRLKSHDCIGNDHATIHLQSNGNNLTWNQYQGGLLTLRGYYIYKRDISGNFTLIDSTVSLTYTDVNFQNGDEYLVEAFKDDGCHSNSWQKANSPLSVRSNKLKIGISGIRVLEQTLHKYYIDGATLFVELKKADDIWIHDFLGRELVHQHTDRLSTQLKPGIYVMNVGIKGYKIIVH